MLKLKMIHVVLGAFGYDIWIEIDPAPRQRWGRSWEARTLGMDGVE